MNYASADATTHTELFDSTLSAKAALSFLKFCTTSNSINIEYHKAGTWNNAAGRYYQVNTYLHTY